MPRFNMDTIIKSPLTKAPYYMNTVVPVTPRLAVIESLLTIPQGVQIDDEEKIARGDLASYLRGTTGELELDEEDTALIKKAMLMHSGIAYIHEVLKALARPVMNDNAKPH